MYRCKSQITVKPFLVKFVEIQFTFTEQIKLVNSIK